MSKEVKNESTQPTITEVRLHFKDVKTVKTTYNKVIDIGEIDHGLWGSFIDKKTSCTVWSKHGGYAEIITKNSQP